MVAAETDEFETGVGEAVAVAGSILVALIGLAIEVGVVRGATAVEVRVVMLLFWLITCWAKDCTMKVRQKTRRVGRSRGWETMMIDRLKRAQANIA